MDKGLHQQWRVEFFRGLIDRFAGPSHGLRLLDLACLEGLFAIEFARQGMETVGLEIRDAHLAKAEFARATLGLANCHFVRGDVRQIPAQLGTFDVTLAAGILYHLDFPDCVHFLRSIGDRTRDLVIIDSHFAYEEIETSVLPLSSMRTYETLGKRFRGREIVEHALHVTDEEKAATHLWASIDNNKSVWLSERSVVDILDERGFALAQNLFPISSYQQNNPDRPTLVFKRR